MDLHVDLLFRHNFGGVFDRNIVTYVRWVRDRPSKGRFCSCLNHCGKCGEPAGGTGWDELIVASAVAVAVAVAVASKEGQGGSGEGAG